MRPRSTRVGWDAMHRTQARFAEVVRGSWSGVEMVEYRGSRCAAEQGSLAVFWRGEINNLGSDDGAPECLWSLTELPEEGLPVLFLLPSFSVSLRLCCFSSFPFPFFPLSAASQASSISKRLTSSVSVRIPLARDVLLMDRRNVMNVAVAKQALQLSPVVKSLMMKWGRAGASTMRSKEDSCR